jgi:hypothetical protein
MVEDIQDSSEFGEDAQTGADKALGQLIDPPADRIGEVWEQEQAIYDAWDQDAAEGVQLDNLGKIAGVAREPATASTGILTLGGTPTTFIPSGSRSRVPGGGIFAHDEDATIGGGGTVDVPGTATETGPIEAAAGSITEIVDPVVGWDTVTNAADAAIGRDIESDAAYRARIRESKSAAGTSTDQAMRAALVALDAITAASVVSNRQIETDALGIPGKAFRAVVWPDTLTTAEKQLTAEVIWNHLPLGIYSDGSDVVATVVDSQGKSQTVRFDFADQVPIWWEIDVTPETGYPSNGDDLVEAAILAYGQALLVGDDVDPIKAERLITDPTDNPYYVPGVKHLVTRVGKASSPTGTTPVIIEDTEISTHASARITVDSS